MMVYMSYSIMKRVHSDVLWHLTHFVLIDYLCDHSYCKYNGVQNFEGVFLETGRFIFFTLKMLSVSQACLLTHFCEPLNRGFVESYNMTH